MPDKLTDNEIVKALEWNASKFPTAGFVYLTADDTKLINTKDVVDLINRQKAEIERLKEQRERLIRFKKYFESLYGQSLEVANFHLNGVLEPLDNFIDSAMDEMGEGK